MSRFKISFDDAVRIGKLDAHAQAGLVHSGALSAEDLIDAAIVRIEAWDPAINAVSHRGFDGARDKAREVAAERAREVAAARTRGVATGSLSRAAGNAVADSATGGAAAVSGSAVAGPLGRIEHPHVKCALAGVPYLIKDSLPCPGMPARAGSRARGDEPSTSAYPFIQRFEREGLVPVGKSSMCEFGLLASNEPLRYGAARNPWAFDLSTGGSSGGAAAAVASGMVPLAHASDAAGSIRMPASCCGLVGLKSSLGANVRARSQNFVDDLLCSDSLLARSVRDVAWAYAVTSPTERAVIQSPIDRRLRIAVAFQNLPGAKPTDEVADVIDKTASLCSRLGHHVERRELPIDGASLFESFQVLWGYLGNEVVEFYRGRNPSVPLEDQLEPWTLSNAEWGRQFAGPQLELAFRRSFEAQRALDDFHREFDIVLSPVLPRRPAKLGELAPTKPFPRLFEDLWAYMSYTPLQNIAGTPAISLPLFTASDEVPIGSMFAANRGQDELLLALALELEQAQPWSDRWPKIDLASRLPIP